MKGLQIINHNHEEECKKNENLINEQAKTLAIVPILKKHNRNLQSKMSQQRFLQSKMNKQKESMKKKLSKNKYQLFNAARRHKASEKKLLNMKNCLQILEEQNEISPTATKELEILSATFSPVLERFLKNSKKSTVSRKLYPPELRRFALTLHAYSAKSYEFVRNKLAKGLPSSNTILRWLQNIDCEPGIIEHSLDILAKKVNEAKCQLKEVYVNLVFDEVSIRKCREFDGKRFFGKVDFGNSNLDSTDEDASEALVFMAVGVNGHWKLPLSFYFICGLKGHERAELLRQNAIALENIGANLISVICDGLSSNLTMAKVLGCNFELENLKTSFTHPGNPNKKIFFLLDICHCIKLVRNIFGTHALFDSEGNEISFNFIEKLDQIQKEEGLRAGNKLGKHHVNWKSVKMKVKTSCLNLMLRLSNCFTIFLG